MFSCVCVPTQCALVAARADHEPLCSAAVATPAQLIRNENRSDKLWVPQASVAQSHATWVKEHYPTAVRASSAIFFPKDGGNVLTANRLKTVMGYHDQIPKIVADGTVDLRVDSLKSAKKVVTWDPTYPGTDIGVCLQASNKCLVTSILDLWNYDVAQAPASDSALLTTLNTPPYTSITGGVVDRASVIGNAVYNPAGSSTIASGGALRVSYLLQNNAELAEGREIDPNADAFEKKWLEVMQQENSDIDVVYFATRSLSDEFGATIRADIPLLSSGYFFIIGYCILMLGRCFAPRGISCCVKGGAKPKRCQVSSSMSPYAYLPMLTHLVCHHTLTYQSSIFCSSMRWGARCCWRPSARPASDSPSRSPSGSAPTSTRSLAAPRLARSSSTAPCTPAFRSFCSESVR